MNSKFGLCDSKLDLGLCCKYYGFTTKESLQTLLKNTECKIEELS
jgi:hypothetical protein